MTEFTCKVTVLEKGKQKETFFENEQDAISVYREMETLHGTLNVKLEKLEVK
ncbi:hypothetical protein [Staphylococcus shinii]|uniref:hypothetical protein n=1 Tax=Staphylococcus shinii TaxID=2912228 RepID=UPI002973E80B|nr:hypothetical protein [Staphylococcus saprophyticus]